MLWYISIIIIIIIIIEDPFRVTLNKHVVNLVSELALARVLSTHTIVLSEAGEVPFLYGLFQEAVQHGTLPL
jgi:hypothetical protein